MTAPEKSATRIETQDLSVHFEDRSALNAIDLSLSPGEIVALVGPNGAGKSTLMRVLAGMLPPSHGRVLVDGQESHGPNACIIYVPQRSAVDWTFPIDVTEVVLLARRKARSRLLPYGGADREAALRVLTSVGMEPFAHVQISRLSGGQQQRVFLARALLQNGDVYLLDEPFTGVDVPTQDVVVEVLRELASRGKTIVFATHDLHQAFTSSNRVILLNRTIIADGPTSEVATDANLRATFGGTSSMFDLVDLMNGTAQR
ncbi:MAG: metal ABC transporter ATP-binding protein [Thermomicrobiales bacterium]|nr:metal ABC transporter ATP-binding protein [Thermomicrobiales bacterium]